MARYEITMIVDIDEDKLAQHDGDLNPPPNEVEEWYVSDFFLARDKGWVDESYSTAENMNDEELQFVRRLG